MTTTPVILRSDPLSRLDPAARRSRRPNVAVVYAAADGTVHVIDGGGPMRLTDNMAGRYRYRYEVDMSHHYDTVELSTSPPPARGGIHHFTARVSIGFRVVDPARVVQRNIHDAKRVVCDHLTFVFRSITVNFPVEAALQAEDAINARLRERITIEGCIELFLCRAILEPDPDAASYLRAEQRARERNRVRGAEHELETDDAERREQIALIHQRGSLERRSREREALDGRPADMQDLLALHIERHPGDTETALDIAERIRDKELAHADTVERRGWEKFQFMSDRNLLQAIDVNQVRDRVVRDVSEQIAPLPVGAAVESWDDPLPDNSHQPDVPPGLIPVYLVVEESAAVAPAIVALDDGLRAAYDTLADQPEIAGVVRLAVLSYATDATVRLPLHEVRREPQWPALTAHPGPVRLAAVFERLRDCILTDAETLKAQTPSPRRPQVLLLSASRPADDGAWHRAHRALVDRESQGYAPDIITCGVGSADPRTIVDIATRGEMAFLAPDHDIESAIDDFCAFVYRRIVDYGRAILDGDQNANVAAPDGFLPATELITSSM